MTRELAYRVDAWLFALGCASLLLAAAEVGFHLGCRIAARIDDARRAQLAVIQGAILSLLALLLGFSFAMAEARYQTRKELVLVESNAIGTTFLRAQLLPEPHHREASRLLDRYVDARLAFHEAGANRARLQRAAADAEQLQAQLWAHGVAAAAIDPQAETIPLFLESLNEVIDLHARRIVALESRVPESILLLLVFVAVLSCGLIGYGNGCGRHRNFVASLLTVIAFVAVIFTIVDLDRADRGFVRVSQESMLRLRHSLSVP